MRALTTTVLHSLRKSWVGSRLVTRTGICSDKRVLSLPSCLRLSNQALQIWDRFSQPQTELWTRDNSTVWCSRFMCT
jgi:hypothetical protein